MVSAGRCNCAARTEASTTAISIPGHAGSQRLNAKISAAEPSPSPSVAGLIVGKAWARTASLGSSRPGSAPASRRPARPLTWLAKMVTAMPQVKPTVTAWGMWRIRPPSRKAPINASITPDIRTASSRPSRPNRAPVAATTVMKAPAGPPI